VNPAPPLEQSARHDPKIKRPMASVIQARAMGP